MAKKSDKKGMGINDTYAIIVGLVLLILGIWGLTTVPAPYYSILGLFNVNLVQSVVYMLMGSAVYFGYVGRGKEANLAVGAVALLAGLLWFVAPGLVVSLLNNNANTAYLHLAVGLVSLAVALGIKEE